LAEVQWPPIASFDAHYNRLHLYIKFDIGRASETIHVEVTRPMVSVEGISCLVRDELS
jgi:hypothetical protein